MQSYTPARPRKPVELASYDEPTLKRLACTALSPYFEIEHEVAGRFIPDGSRVVIDFLLYPKPALIQQGFVNQHIGLEVKAANVTELTKQALAFAWQSVTYSMSSFKGERPAFVLMFLDLPHFWPERERTVANLIKALLVRSNVGSLLLDAWNTTNFKMDFAGVRHYSNRDGLSLHPNAALKRRVGNSK
jgi:hypothetical protein